MSLLTVEFLRLRSRRLARWLSALYVAGALIAGIAVFLLPADVGTTVLPRTLAIATQQALFPVFVVGASFIGAEFRSGSMAALLVREPRRGRVVFTKLAVAVATAVGVVGVGLGVLTLLAAVSSGVAGSGFGLSATRAVLVVADVATASIGLAFLIRNTGGAIAAWFVVASASSFVTVLRPALRPWMLAPSLSELAGTLVTGSPLLRPAIVCAAYAIAFLLLGWTAFVSRDAA